MPLCFYIKFIELKLATKLSSPTKKAGKMAKALLIETDNNNNNNNNNNNFF